VVVVVVVVKVYAQPAGLPINPQPRPVIAICRLVTIIGKCKTNILKIQIEVTIRKTALKNPERLFIYIGVAQKGAKRLIRIKNESRSGASKSQSGEKTARTDISGPKTDYQIVIKPSAERTDANLIGESASGLSQY